jgi:hypothetical protein
MKKSIFWIVVSILAFATVAGFILFYFQSTENKKVTSELSALSVQSTKTALDLSVINKDLSDKAIKLESDLNEKKTVYNTLNSNYIELLSKYTALADKALCQIDKKYTFDMSNQNTISESLKIFVGDTTGKVTNATWDNVWSNAKTAIHKLNTKDYLIEFVIDIKDDSRNTTNLIYWVDSQCFIDESQLK